MLAFAAGLGVLMGIILMLLPGIAVLPGIAAPVVPAVGLNGSTGSVFQMRDVLCVMVASRMR